MRHLPPNSPKISTLPRQQTEASILLDLHKLVSEKNRLQQELIQLEARQTHIHQRLEAIAIERDLLEQNRRSIRTRVIDPIPQVDDRASANTFDVTLLEY
ncbi:MAG: hypothetical protein F6K28_61085 [Microcoleus sp. SIO2G3]|nr:hypothetical protein [Microcoleus sp. SIO2G3]